MRLIDNLYYYPWSGRGNNCNSYLFADVLRSDRPHIIIDPGHVVNEMGEQCLNYLLKSINADGIKAEEIGLILNTHAHVDHNESNQPLVEKTLRKSATGKTEQALIALHKDAVNYQRTMSPQWAKLLGTEFDFEPNFFLEQGDLNLGKENKLNLEVIETPGHSPGSICFYWPDKKVLITGDVVFYGGVGRTDLPGGDGKLLKQSIERLSKFDTEYLLPGHSTEFGGIIKGKEKVTQNFSFIKINYFPFL